MTESKEFLESKNSKIHQQNHYTSPSLTEKGDDIIDIFKLCNNLWRKKWIIIIVTTIAILLSVFYAFKQPNLYMAEALIYPPTLKNVEALNLKKNLMETDQVGEILLNIRRNVFTAFKNNLGSRVLQKKFIQENDLLSYLAPNNNENDKDVEILENFSDMVKIRNLVTRFGDKEGISVSIETEDPEFAAKLINDYINFFNLATVRTLAFNKRSTIDILIKDIESTIRSKRKLALIRRQDQITRYKEAAIIATKLGAFERIEGTNVVQNNQQQVALLEMGTLTPLYYLGSKALKAEILTLKNRISDDPFIVGLREMQQKLFLLRSIKINEEELTSVTVDRPAYPSDKRIQPNRRKIVLQGTLIGLFLGVFISIVVTFLQNKNFIHSY